MRRNWLIALLGLLSIWMTGSISAQTQQRRLVLIEEFTNTGCGPCASWSPLLDSAINYRLGDCIAIKYHSGYPYAQDPFYNYDKTAQQGKVDFYHVTGVPATYVDGQELATRTYAFLQQAINWCQEQAPGGTLTVEKQLGSNQLLSTTARFTPYYNIENRRVRLFVAAIEEHVAIDPTQAPNGERDLYYTMRKMISPAEGYDMGATLSEGTTYNFEGEWVMDFLDDIHELGVVAYVQDLDTHEVLQAAYSGPDAEGQDRLALMNVTDTPDLICLPNYYGTVLLRNDGANEVSSATLNVEVNGTLKQYPWTGHLGYLDRDTMTFDGLTNFQLTTGTTPNQVRVWFSDINGGNATSNTRNLTFSNSVQATYAVQLKIYTDKKPEEITWKLYNSAGDVIQQGGPYDGQARKLITEKLELNEDDCYQIEFTATASWVPMATVISSCSSSTRPARAPASRRATTTARPISCRSTCPTHRRPNRSDSCSSRSSPTPHATPAQSSHLLSTRSSAAAWATWWPSPTIITSLRRRIPSTWLRPTT